MPEQKKKNIVVLGAGFGGIYTFKRLHSHFHGDSSVNLILVNRENYFLFTPLLHEVATGSIFAENIVEPIRKVIGCCLANFYLSEVKKISLKDKWVETDSEKVPYDRLVIALGAETNFYNTPGADEFCYTLKDLRDALRLKNHFIGTFERAVKEKRESLRRQMMHFVVIGGGPTGVELAAEMAEFFYDTFQKYFDCKEIMHELKVTIIQRGEELIPQFSSHMRKKSAEVLKNKMIDVRLGVGVVEVGKDYVVLDNGDRLATLTAIWVAGVKPSEVSFDEEIKRERGKIVVDEMLRMPSHKHVYVLGDMSSLMDQKSGKPLPALAQVATQEGKTVADNVRASLTGKKLKPFKYFHKGSLVSVGQWVAIAEFSKFHIFGHIAWWFWRTVYLSKLISWQKKFQVSVDWTINLFSPRDISRFGGGELPPKR